MLDYYGSILKSDEEIDTELISKFRSKCYESYIRLIISDLREEGILQKDYSVSGWNAFSQRIIYEIFEKNIEYQKQKKERKIKFLYCYNQLFEDYDILRLICDKL